MQSRFRKNIFVIIMICTVLAAMITLVSFSPTLYRIFCATTGFGGTVRKATAVKHEENSGKPLITVYFDSNVASDLDWEFSPAQRKVEARIGDPVKVYYDVTNRSDETIVARAVYNITPYKAASYFFKIECFCFTEERLGPGESAHMPLVFYVDDQFLKDKSMDDVTAITLSYTFYKKKDLTPEEVGAARNLKAGSQKLDSSLKEDKKMPFENDSRRR